MGTFLCWLDIFFSKNIYLQNKWISLSNQFSWHDKTTIWMILFFYCCYSVSFLSIFIHHKSRYACVFLDKLLFQCHFVQFPVSYLFIFLYTDSAMQIMYWLDDMDIVRKKNRYIQKIYLIYFIVLKLLSHLNIQHS